MVWDRSGAPDPGSSNPSVVPSKTEAPLTVPAARNWRHRWDLQQEFGIPYREARFEAILEVLGVAVGPRFRVLDLGCGTGSLSERILRRYPRASSVAVDHDPVLLKIAKTGLGDLGGRLAYVDADLSRPDWTARLPNARFDAAVSTTALHWLTGSQLTRLFQDVGRLLRPGGWFVNGDQLEYPAGSPQIRRLARSVRQASPSTALGPGETWDAWWRAVLRDPRFAAEAKLHRLRYPHSHRRTKTPDLAGHVRRLRAAGFREVEVVWSRWENRVVVARR
jgi:SAM-dependent methyltransferase